VASARPGPFRAELFTSYAVTAKMNRAAFDEAEAIFPLEPAISSVRHLAPAGGAN
jgi:hypothetical protein